MSEENKEIVRKYRKYHNENRLDQLDQVIASSLISHNMMPGVPAGLAGAKTVHQSLVASFPDLRTQTDELLADGDKVIERWTDMGTHTGTPFMGTPATGKKFKVSGISIYRIANGKITEHWGEFNSLAVMQQLGLVPQQQMRG